MGNLSSAKHYWRFQYISVLGRQAQIRCFHQCIEIAILSFFFFWYRLVRSADMIYFFLFFIFLMFVFISSCFFFYFFQKNIDVIEACNVN